MVFVGMNYKTQKSETLEYEKNDFGKSIMKLP
jgi:hypothetical protein